jgi:hypothetical protein
MSAGAVYLALSKGEYQLRSARLFQWRTRSPYPHCEIVVESADACSRFYGVYHTGGVKMHFRRMDPDRWDFIPLPGISAARVEAIFAATAGQPFNMLGMLCVWIGLPVKFPGRWRCSEWAAHVIGLDRPHAQTIRTVLDSLACRRATDMTGIQSKLRGIAAAVRA